MALAEAEVAVKVLTYEQYLAEGQVAGFYDIIDGVRMWKVWDMTSPLWEHQSIAKRILRVLLAFEDSGQGVAQFAPLDVLILHSPLRTRQPELLFVSHARLTEGGGPPTSSPLSVAPELVVEILSSSDTRRVLNGKIMDFCAAGVNECWIVSPNAESVEVLRLTPDGPERMAIHGTGDTVNSVAFPELTMSVSDIFSV